MSLKIRLLLIQCFNPRPPSGERPAANVLLKPAISVSIHAPRVGSDFCSCRLESRYILFQSTPPEWGATSGLSATLRAVEVSIHAPRVGSDCPTGIVHSHYASFNPRPPSGERPGNDEIFPIRSVFQSTPPEWGATARIICQYRAMRCFNPRPPSGERLGRFLAT